MFQVRYVLIKIGFEKYGITNGQRIENCSNDCLFVVPIYMNILEDRTEIM